MSWAAEISDCGKYRYVLRRRIPYELTLIPGDDKMLFIMLNPSKADATITDNTVRKCMGFARLAGRTEITVVNLFAYRATDPDELTKAEDPVGPLNLKYLQEELERHKDFQIVAAWGSNKLGVLKARELKPLLSSYKIKCLKKSKDGNPWHPLYVPYKESLKDFGDSYAD